MRTIETQGQVKVVEYERAGQVRRCVLPVGSDEVDLGIPYGLPFAGLLTRRGMDERMAARIEQELHRAGLWTAADVLANPRAAQGAIQAAYGVDVAVLLNLVRSGG